MSPTASPSPTSGSLAKAGLLPAWLVWLLMPFYARNAAREMSAKYPGLSGVDIGLQMRAELGDLPTEAQSRFIDAVVEHLPRAAPRQTPGSAWLLVAANLVPLAGVLLWNWNAFALIALFWMETVVIGASIVLQMLCARPSDPLRWLGKLFIVPLFCFLYGAATAFYGAIALSLFGSMVSPGRYQAAGSFDPWAAAARAIADYDLWLPLAALAASHLFSFAWNYLYRGEFRHALLSELAGRPFARMILLHIFIIVGGIGSLMLGSPVWALVLLIAIKIGLDWRGHRNEHSRA
jgi:hypothetical protein